MRFTHPDAGPAAAKLLRRLQDAPRILAAHPYAGRRSEDHPDVMQLVVAGYRLIYRIYPDTGDTATTGDVEILTVLSPGEP
jgi:plasmid stabilization system protein ParE